MNSPRRVRHPLCLVALATILLVQAGLAQALKLTPLKTSGTYEVGEKIAWTVEATGEQKPASASFTLKKNGLTAFKTGALDLSSGKATVETSLDEPGSVLLEIQTPTAPAADGKTDAPRGGGRRGGRGNRTLAGALVAPQKLQPASPRPADFDAFWKSKIEQLHAVPSNPRVNSEDGGKDGVDYALVRMDNVGGTKIYGQLAKPKRTGKFPALLILQWAGVYPLQKPWVTARAAEGWMALNIEPHDLPGDQPVDFYSGKLANYWALGQDDRDQSYFLRMYLSAYRAVDFLADHPDWDGKTLVVMGTSMGGQQTFATAGLHPKVTAMMACVPASCDMTGPEHGRAAGFPDWARSAQQKTNPKILETGRYFDPVNFASRIKVPALVAMGYIDETCPPVGVWAAINQIQGPVEPLPMIDSPHQDVPRGVQRPWQIRSAEWLAALAKGETVKHR